MRIPTADRCSATRSKFPRLWGRDIKKGLHYSETRQVSELHLYATPFHKFIAMKRIILIKMLTVTRSGLMRNAVRRRLADDLYGIGLDVVPSPVLSSRFADGLARV